VPDQDKPQDKPVVQLSNVKKVFGKGEAAVVALKNVNLDIQAGEMVAITGCSGSGKSTLMNLIGCLDRPTEGTCYLNGQDIATLSSNEQATLRNQTIGFVFQSFNLLSRTTALENVELPLQYDGAFSPAERTKRATMVLERVGLGDRMTHHPNELSGGQQQRVAIARALVSDPAIILADEPTGNLDTESSEEIIKLLEQLNAEGITVVVVTHEAEVAARCSRRVVFKDGEIISDDCQSSVKKRVTNRNKIRDRSIRWVNPLAAIPLAFRTVSRNKLRSFLTTLGVVIGVGAVVGMLAMGQGARAALRQQVANMGTNLVRIRPGSVGRGGHRWGVGTLTNLTIADAQAIARDCPSISLVCPQVRSVAQIKAGAANWSATVEGVGENFHEIRNWGVTIGRPLSPSDLRQGTKVCLLGTSVVQELFGGNNPVGAVVRLDRVPFTVQGVLRERGESSWGRDQDDVVIAPIGAVQRRLMGITHINSITTSAMSANLLSTAADEIRSVMRVRHKIKKGADDDFVVRTQTEMNRFAGGMFSTMTMLLTGIAAVSLLVGGIGIMNIMLVSVTERTREIGIRMAVGAQGRDIMVQFLVEAVVLSAGGGILGILLGMGIDQAVSAAAGWPSGLSTNAIVLAFGFSAAVGIFFGIYPARVAAKLDPIQALQRE